MITASYIMEQILETHSHLTKQPTSQDYISDYLYLNNFASKNYLYTQSMLAK